MMTKTNRPRRLSTGDTVPRRELTTIRSASVTVPDEAALVHLQFRRYAGCPICHLHLRSVAARQDEIHAAGIREIVVFHSTVAVLLPYQDELPFDVVADPAKELYTEFGVEKTPRAVLDPRTWPAMLRGGIGRKPTGPGKGQSPFGLPADFLIGPDGRIRAVRYARHADDQWRVDELLGLAAEAGASS
jgi:peroxiredoxin